MKRKQKINKYKVKRLLKRRVYSLRDSVGSAFLSAPRRRHHDFSWRGKRANPHVTRRRPVDWKLRIKVTTITGASIATVGLLFFHPRFQIQDVQVHGLVRIPEHEVLETARAAMQGRAGFIVPRSNYFLFNTSELAAILKEKFPLEHISVQKKFPYALTVAIEEKISNIIYDNSEKYGYIDLSGNVVEIKRNVLESEWKVETKAVTSTNELGEEVVSQEETARYHTPDTKAVTRELGILPILYDTRRRSMEINTTVVDKETSEAVVEWFNYLTKHSDLPIAYFEIGEGKDLLIHTHEGWHIKTREGGVEKQYMELTALLKEKVERPHLSYVDLRFAGRIYWK